MDFEWKGSCLVFSYTALRALLLYNTYSIMALSKRDWKLDPYFYLCNLIALQTILKL